MGTLRRDVAHLATRRLEVLVRIIGSRSGWCENGRNFRWNCDGLPAQALTQDSQQPEFRSLHCDWIAVQADEFLDHSPSSQLGAEPLGPFRQYRQAEAYSEPVHNELGCIVVKHRSSRFAVGAKRCLKEHLRKKHGVAHRTLALRNLHRRPVEHGFFAKGSDALVIISSTSKTKRLMRCRQHAANVLVAAADRAQV